MKGSFVFAVAAALAIGIGCRRELPTSPLGAAARNDAQAASRRMRAVTPGIREVPPPCVDPAPFHLSPWPAPGYIFIYRPGVDPITTTTRFEQEYGFKATYVYTVAIPGFSAVMTVQSVAAVRCENEILFVEENGQGTLLHE